ncbi:MAG TPA: GAF domain-containing protein [Pyrinomonadaceae bacterium]|nr:GAF domain-containing protein [Pyrinomonadaceae bacterium]
MSIPSPGQGEHDPLQSTQADFESTLRAVCEAAVKLVRVSHSGLVLFARDRVYGTVVAEFPPGSALHQRVQVKGVPLEEKLIRERKPIVVSDVREEQSLGSVQDVLVSLNVFSLVVVPIIVDQEVKGSFSFDSIGEPRVFGADDIEKCTGLARFASYVVKNAHLLSNLGALQEAMLAVVSGKERGEILETITKEAVRLLQAEGGAMDELEPRRGELTVVAAYHMKENILGKTIKVGEGLAGRIISEERKYMTVPNYAEWEGRAPAFKDTLLESLVGVPLQYQDKPTGVLWVNAPRPREFTHTEIELLQGLAAPASIALEQSELRQKERDKAGRLDALAKATNDIYAKVPTSSRKERLHLIAKHARAITDAEVCGILLVEKPGWLTLIEGDGYRQGQFDEGLELELTSGEGTGLTGHIAFEGKIFREFGEALTKHFAVRKKRIGKDYPPSGECCSILAIPLKKENGEVCGLLNINNKHDKDGKPSSWTGFTDDDETIGEIFAQAAIVAIETADLLDEVKLGQERYKMLLDTSNVLSLTKVPEAGLGGLAEIVLSKINKSFCRILSYDDSDSTLQVIAAEKAAGKKGEFLWDRRIGEKTEVSNWRGLAESLNVGQLIVQRRGSPEADANLHDISKLVQLRDLEGNPLELSAVLRSPLKVGDRIIGLLIIGEIDEACDFDQFEIDQAQAISNQASLSIERLRQDKKLLQSLFEIEREISSSNDVYLALELIAKQAYEIGRRYGRKVNVVDINVREGNTSHLKAAYPDGQLERIRAIVGHPFNLDAGWGPKKQIGLVGRVLQTGEWIMEADVRANHDYVAIHENTLSQLVVPIKEGNETIGAISVESSEIRAFDLEDLMLLEGLASVATSALSKDKQFQETNRLLIIFDTAYRGLRHAFHEKLGFMSQLLDEAQSCSQPAVVKSLLKTVATNLHSLDELLSRSQEQLIQDEQVNVVIVEALANLVESSRLKHLWFDPLVDFSRTADSKVPINKFWFQQHVLRALLVNAREATSAAPIRRIEVRTELTGEPPCLITVSNNGPKVEDQIWDKLGFEPIEKSNPNRGGGLFIANLVLKLYNGKLEKISNKENNIVIGIRLPLSV